MTTLHYSNTSITSSVQPKPDSSSDISMLSGFSFNLIKKNIGSLVNYLPQKPLNAEFGDNY